MKALLRTMTRIAAGVLLLLTLVLPSKRANVEATDESQNERASRELSIFSSPPDDIESTSSFFSPRFHDSDSRSSFFSPRFDDRDSSSSFFSPRLYDSDSSSSSSSESDSKSSLFSSRFDDSDSSSSLFSSQLYDSDSSSSFSAQPDYSDSSSSFWQPSRGGLSRNGGSNYRTNTVSNTHTNTVSNARPNRASNSQTHTASNQYVNRAPNSSSGSYGGQQGVSSGQYGGGGYTHHIARGGVGNTWTRGDWRETTGSYEDYADQTTIALAKTTYDSDGRPVMTSLIGPWDTSK